MKVQYLVTAPGQSFINAQSAYLPFACRHGHGRSACPGRHEFGDPNSWSPRGSWVFSHPPLVPSSPFGRWAMGAPRKQTGAANPKNSSQKQKNPPLDAASLLVDAAFGRWYWTVNVSPGDRPPAEDIGRLIIRHSPTPQHEGFRRPPARQPPGDPTASARLSLDSNSIRSVDFWSSCGEMWDGQRVVPFPWELPWQTPTLPTFCDGQEILQSPERRNTCSQVPRWWWARSIASCDTGGGDGRAQTKTAHEAGADRERRLPFVHGALLSAPSSNGWCSFTNTRSPGHGTPHRMKKGGV